MRPRLHALALLCAGALSCDRCGGPAGEAPRGDAGAPSPGASGGVATPGTPAPRHEERAGFRYLHLLTGGATEGEALPLVIALHCMGCAPEDWLPAFERFPDKARVILPYGRPFGGSYDWFHFSPGEHTPADALATAERLAAFLDSLSSAVPTKGRPAVVGFSQGAFLAYILAARHPRSVGAVIPISGSLPPGAWPSGWPAGVPKPVIRALHGKQDEAVPFREARAAIEHLRGLGLDAELREYDVAHELTPEMERDWAQALRQAAGR